MTANTGMVRSSPLPAAAGPVFVPGSAAQTRAKKKLKYIIFDAAPFEVPVVWPADVGMTHADVARSVHTGRPISAGFTHPETWAAFGESLSLKLQSRPAEDAALLRKYFAPEPLGAGSKPHAQGFLFPKE